MTDLPALFDRKGAFLPLADDVLATLTPERQELYADVADAATNMAATDAELAEATAAVKACADAVRDAEKQMPKVPTYHDLWRATFGRPRPNKQSAPSVSLPSR